MPPIAGGGQSRHRRFSFPIILFPELITKLPEIHFKIHNDAGTALGASAEGAYLFAASNGIQAGYFLVRYDNAILRTNPAIALPASLKAVPQIYNKSVFYHLANNWIVSGYAADTDCGSNMSAAPADRALLDGCLVLASGAGFFLALAADGSLFLADSVGDTASSPDAAAVRAVRQADVRNVVPGSSHVAIVRHDGTVLVARGTPSAPAVDASALSGAKGFAFRGSGGGGIALLADGSLCPVSAAIPPEAAGRRFASVRSGSLLSQASTVTLLFYDDTE